jgi:flagellar hook-associated protein 2
MRISGLASGIDTDEIIKNLMKVERLRVDKYEQDKQITLWRQEIYNNLNKDFANFILNTRKELGLISTTSTGSYMPNSYNNLKWVKKVSSSDETKVTASGTSKAVNGNFELKVNQLAKGATFVSADMRTYEFTEDELEFKLSVGVGKDGNPIEEMIKVSKVPGSNSITMDDVVKAINSTKVKMLDGSIVKDEDIDALPEDDRKRVKEVSLGASAFYDKDNGRLFLQTTETGKNTRIKIESNNNEFMNAIGYNDALEKQNEKLGQPYDALIGQDAEVLYNDTKLTYSTNRFNINNIDIEAKSTGEVTITVDTDVDGMMEKIEKLVNDYNEIIDKASKLMGEKRYSSYKPLTAEEKKAMDKDDVKLWEEKAKSGLLRGDELISRTLQNVRGHLYEKIEGGSSSFKLITDIGISTEKYLKGNAGGRLQIDKDKLRKAIIEDPEGVLEILFKEPDYSSDELKGISSYTNEKDLTKEQLKAKRSQSGIFTRVYDDLIFGMQDIINKSGSGDNAELYRGVKSNILLEFVTKYGSISTLDKDVLQMERKIDDLNAMLFRKENAYYAKFTAMEKAISQMNSQSAWIGQQFMR